MYPTKIRVNDRIYELDTDYRTALACFRAINDKSISSFKRSYAVLSLLVGNFYIEDIQELKEKCGIYLRCGKKENSSKKDADMDYLQDEEKIRTSIRQCYHLNLNQVDYMHWWEYNELIEGLTEETLLSKVREIRSYDLSDETNLKRREQIIEAKKQLALEDEEIEELTDEEQKNVSAFDEAMNL